MKLKIEQVVESFQVLGRLGQEKMPVKLAYEIQRNARLMEPDFKAREEKRVELIKTKYGVTGENGDIMVLPDRMEAFVKDMMDLDSVEVELDLHTIDLDNLNINITPNDLFWLDWMFAKSAK
jgi:hypothetical protein